MLAAKVSRTAQRVCPSIAVAAIPGTFLAGSTTRGTHRRRHSSSKASCPPDSNDKPATAAKVAAAAASPSATITEAASPQSLTRSKRTGKYRRSSQDKLLKMKEEEQAFAYASLPAVPRVEHMDSKDLSFSQFFSLHRPISVTTPFPPSVTEEAFAAIFESKEEQDSWANGNSAERRPEDVIYALNETIASIEQDSAASQGDVVHIDALTEAASSEEAARQLDNSSRSRIPLLEDIVARARPFHAPPPPQPFVSSTKQEKKASTRQNRQASPRMKSYTTTIVLTESTLPNGETTYEASASPIVCLPDLGADAVVRTSRRARFQRRRSGEALAPAYRARQHGQQNTIRAPRSPGRIRYVPKVRKPAMQLISVKRQRKLKMKKHKYKKLMRRTRNLRRRLENK